MMRIHDNYKFPLPTVHDNVEIEDVLLDDNNLDSTNDEIKRLLNLSTSLDEIIPISLKGKWAEKVNDILINRLTQIRYHLLKEDKQSLEIICCYCGCDLSATANAAREKSNEQINKAREILNESTQSSSKKYNFSMIKNPWLGNMNDTKIESDNIFNNNHNSTTQCKEKTDTSADDIEILSQKSSSKKLISNDEQSESSNRNKQDLRNKLLNREKQREIKYMNKRKNDEFDDSNDDDAGSEDNRRSREKKNYHAKDDDESEKSSFNYSSPYKPWVGRGRGGYRGSYRGRGRGGTTYRNSYDPNEKWERYYPRKDKERHCRSRSPVYRNRSRSKSRSRCESNNRSPSEENRRSTSRSGRSRETERRSRSRSRDLNSFNHQSRLMRYKSPTSKRSTSKDNSIPHKQGLSNSKENLYSKRYNSQATTRHQETTEPATNDKNIPHNSRNNSYDNRTQTKIKPHDNIPLQVKKASQEQDDCDKSNNQNEREIRKLKDSEKNSDNSDDDDDEDSQETIVKPRFKTTRKRTDFKNETNIRPKSNC